MSKSNISGIYSIKNKVNGKQYIGSSKSVYYRWKQNHLPQLNNGNHFNRHLQSAWNKYGEKSFEFQVIEECDKELLFKREGYWIETTKSWEREYGYNFIRIIDGKRVCDKESIQKRIESRLSNNYWITGDNAKILKLFNEDMNKNAIAKKLGVTRSAVYSCLEHHGLHENTGKGSEIKLTEEVREQVQKLRNKGKTWKEIIDNVPVSGTQLFRAKAIIPDGNYNSNKIKRNNYRTVTTEVVKQVEQLRNEGKKWEEIENELGVSRFALHQNGVTHKFKLSRKGEKKNKMTDEMKLQIKDLFDKGKSMKEVHEITNVAKSTIRSYGLHK